jgi:2-(1,2-epoxy-1,2-dihydrophenyl)acetyl-CoA isomerase
MSLKSPTEELIVEVENGIAVITFNRPDKLNAITPTFFDGLAQVCREASADESIKCLVITGKGSGFCAGADITGGNPGIDDALSERPLSESMKEWTYNKFVGPVGYQILDIWNCIKPMICAINGVAVAAGLSIAGACDIRIASDRARFGMRFQLVGLVPDACATYFLPRLIGYDKAFELYVTDDLIGADEALKLGLVTRVVPHDKLMDAAMRLANTIVEGPSLAQILTKRGMREGLMNNIRTQIDYESYAQNFVRTTDDFKNAIKSFREKKKPKFKGR